MALTLDEAIRHCYEVARSNQKLPCDDCKNEHLQLAKWLEELKQLKIADVVEVKHGKWIKKPFVSPMLKSIVKNEFVYTCSVCSYDSISESNYCRVCGAKMDGTPKERGGEK